MARKAGVRVVLGALVLALLATGVVLAAASGHGAREMRFACANNDSGLMRYVAAPSDCHSGSETTIRIAALAKKGEEVQACTSVKFALAKTRDHKGHRIVIPRGTVWRTSRLDTCSGLEQRGITLSGRSKIYFCAVKSDGLLRYISAPGACKRREIALFVPKGRSKPPKASPQQIQTNEGTPVAINLKGSSSPPGKPIAYEIATKPTHGTLAGTPPHLTYTPAAGFFGTDKFTFTTSQHKLEGSPATVSITVNQVDQPPVNNLPGAQKVNENTSLVFSATGKNAISLADSDSQGAAEQIKLSVTHGTLKLATTSGLESSSGNETTSVTAKGTIATLNGALEGLTYTPTTSFHGADSLTVETNDLGHSGLGGPKTTIGTVAITVLQVDQAPTNTVPGPQETKEGASLTFSSAGKDAISVSDVDSEGAVEQVKLSVLHGTLKLGTTGGLESSSGNETASVTAKGTITSLNQALEGLTYTPGASYFGTDSVTLETNDLGHTGLEGPKTVTSTVAITIIQVDQAPTSALPIAQTTNENTSLTFSTLNSNQISVADIDSEGGVEQLKLNVSHGTLKLGTTAGLESSSGNETASVTANGTIVALNQALEGLLYTPDHDYHAADELELEVNDLGHTGAEGPKTSTGTVALAVEPVVYDTAVDDSYSTNENETLTVNSASGVLANDSDSDGLSLEAKEVVAQPAHGTVALSPDGSFTYVPTPNYHGADSFTYKDTDGNTDSNVATVTLTVNTVTYDKAVDDSYSTNENETLTVNSASGVLANDTDSDSPKLTLEAKEVVGKPVHGAVTLNSDGSFTYVPTPNYHGADSFTYRDNDGNTDSNVATVTLTVNTVTYDKAVNDSYTTNENETLTVNSASGVLANDTDSDSPKLTLEAKEVVAKPAHGTVKLNLDGSFEYTPESNFVGSDSFTYKDTDGNTDSNVATVTLTVNTVTYDKAVDDSYSTNENETLTVNSASGVLANDTDSDSPKLTLEAKEVVGKPVHGAVTLNSDGSFTYVPTPNYHGADSFTYRDNDGNTDSNVATVTLTVNTVTYDKAVNDSYTTNENEALTVNSASGVLANDTDSDTPPLALKVKELVVQSTHGTVTLNADGSFKYTPELNYVGPDSFTYKDNDGNTDSNTATVSLTVKPVVYDKAVNDSYSVVENEALIANAASGVLANDTDSDKPPLVLHVKEVVAQPTHGTVTLNADGSFKYTPELNYVGPDSFTYKDNDGNTDSNTATVTLTVSTVVYDKAVNDSYSTNENKTLIVNSASGVLVNDTDSDKPPLALHVKEVVAQPTHGTVTLNADGSLEYVPTHNYHGSDSFTYKDNDGNTDSNIATVTLTVEPVVYDKAVNDSYSTEQDQKLEVAAAGVLSNDTDSDSPPLALTVKEVVSKPTHGTVKLNADGSFEYTPNHLFFGEDSFTYRDTDGNAESNVATVTITVTKATFDHAVNDSYTVNENATLSESSAEGVLSNDTDSEGLTLAAELVSPTSHGKLSLKSDGSFTYEPESGFSGADSFTYKDNDENTTSNTATVSIAVKHVDRAPANTVPGEQTVNSGESIVFSSAGFNAISVSDSDSEGGVEQVKLSASHGTLTPGITAGLVSDSGSGTEKLTLEGTIAALNTALEGLTYTASSHYGGPDTLTIATDDLGHTGVGGPKTTTSEVPIAILHVNETPVNTVPGKQEVEENTPLVFSKAAPNAISVADADSEGGAEQVKLSVEHGTLKAGSLAGLVASSGNGTGTLTLEGTITALNSALEGATYTPTANFSGVDTLTLKTDDLGHTGAGGAKTATSTVEIVVVHPPPIPTNPTYSGAIGNTEFSVGVPAGGAPDVEQSGSVLPSPAEEPDGSTLTVTAETISSAHSGTVHMNEDGTFTYQPAVGFHGENDTFKYKENDSRGGEATGTVTIEVSSARVWYVNDNLPSNGNGESNSPFNVLSAVSGGASPTGSGDVLFLYGGGGNYTGGVELKASQTLDGQDEGLTVEGHDLVSASGANPTITNGSGAGIKLAETDAIKGITVSGTSGAGIAASNAGGFTLDSKVTVTSTTGNGLEVSGGSGAITDEATISTSSAHSLLVEKRTGGTLTAAGPITDTGTGVLLNSNTGATIDFTGKLNLSTTTHGAFSATAGGTVAATNTESTAATTTGVAVNVQNTTIGASGVKFQSVSTNGAAIGIDLQNTGASGGLSVTGAGTSSSGGEIQKATNAGVLLNNTSSPSLSWMHIHEAGNFGISGETVSGLTLSHDVIDGTNGGIASTEPASVALKQLTGIATISNSTITGGYEDDVRIQNNSGTLSPLTLSSDTFSETNADSHGNDDLLIIASGSSTVNPTFINTSFTAARNDLLDLDVSASASSTMRMDSASPNNNRFTNNNSGIVSGGGGVLLSAGGQTSATSTLNYDIENTTFEGALGNAVSIGSAAGTNTVVGKFIGNTVGVLGVGDSGSEQGSDLSIGGVEHGTITTAIEGNKLYQYNDDGLVLSSADEEGSAPFLALNATIKNNTIAHPDVKNALNGLDVEAGTGAPTTETKVCLNTSGNTLTGSGVEANGGFDAILAVNSNDTISLQGYGGAANNESQIQNFIGAQNTVDAPFSNSIGAFSGTGTIKASASNCPTPP